MELLRLLCLQRPWPWTVNETPTEQAPCDPSEELPPEVVTPLESVKVSRIVERWNRT